MVKVVEKNLQFDWYEKPEAHDAIRSAHKRELRRNIDINNLYIIFAEIMEQSK